MEDMTRLREDGAATIVEKQAQRGQNWKLSRDIAACCLARQHAHGQDRGLLYSSRHVGC